MRAFRGSGALSRAQRNRTVLERLAPLLSGHLTLDEVFHAFGMLLAQVAPATHVTIALKDPAGARVVFLIENGAVVSLRERAGAPEHSIHEVLRSGEATNTGSELCAPLTFSGEKLGAVALRSARGLTYDAEDVALIEACAGYLSVRLHDSLMQTRSERLANMASLDGLTGVLNRRTFNERLATEWSRGVRHATPICAIIVDIDFFKIYNDTYGHQAGDTVLAQVAQALASCISRTEDVFARYGGEEFVALLPGTSVEGALVVAERMRKTVFDLQVGHSGSALGVVTVSVGVASATATSDLRPDRVLSAADAALYEAKRLGRNRVAADAYVSDAPHAAASVKRLRGNLPRLSMRLHRGRDDVNQLRRMLRVSRCVTVTGDPGVGKSRFALEAAHSDIAHFTDGVYYVDCAALSDAGSLAVRFAQAIGMRKTAASVVRPALAEYLRTKRVLVVFDNCDRYRAAVSEFTVFLVEQTRNARVLATCCEPLRAPREVALTAPSLSPEEAAQMFAELSGMDSNDATVREAVSRLGGTPRAIAIVAAQARRSGAAPPSEVLDIDALLAWFWNRTGPQAQLVLAHVVAFPEGAPDRALDAMLLGKLGSVPELVAHGILAETQVHGVTRWVVPSFARDYILRVANDQGVLDDARRAFARYYAGVARSIAEAASFTVRQQRVEDLILDADNLRAALHFMIAERADIEGGARMAVDLVRFWIHAGRNNEGREWFSLLERDRAGFPKALRADLLFGISNLVGGRSPVALADTLEACAIYRELGDLRHLAGALYDVGNMYCALARFEEADRYYNESLEIAYRIESGLRIGSAFLGLGLSAYYAHDPDRARRLLEQSLEVFRSTQDERAIGMVLGNLGDVAATVGDYDRAVTLTRQALAIYDTLRDDLMAGWLLGNLGSFEQKRGDLEAARDALRRALGLVRERRDDWLTAMTLDAIARIALADGEPAHALALVGYADGILETLGLPRQPADERDYRRLCASASAELGAAEAHAQMELGRSLEWPEILRQALRV